MGKNFKRLIELQNAPMKKLVEQKQALVAKGAKAQEEAEEIVKQHEKKVEEIKKVADDIRKNQNKIISLVKKDCEKKDLLTDYEVPLTTEVKDGQLLLTVEDQLEMFKDRMDGVDKFKEIPELKQ